MQIVSILEKNRADLRGVGLGWAVQRRRKSIAKTGFDSNRKDACKLHLGPGANWAKPSDDWLSVNLDADRDDFVLQSHQPELLGGKLIHRSDWDFEAMQANLTRVGCDESGVIGRIFSELGSSHFDFEGTYPSEANEFERSPYVEAQK
ncbi:hypothetical protein [Parasphingorhabdus sp.]|uniref:hypothetical protein n=1 Tax=Parasphingorhabdus sp. TaxID=2709688 RepID=UPI003A8D2330